MFFYTLIIPPLYRLRNAAFGVPDSITTARRLTEKASRKAFRLYSDPIFRAGVSFDTLETTEQDRVFNELVVANLTLEILMMETFAKYATGEKKEWACTTSLEIPRQYIESLRNLSIKDEYLDIWKKLISLRQDEYEQIRLEHRGHFPELGEGNPWVRVVAVGCLFHIRRAKDVPDDPLFPLILKQAITIANLTRRSIQPIAFG